jgi:hypothetical protein
VVAGAATTAVRFGQHGVRGNQRTRTVRGKRGVTAVVRRFRDAA